MKKTALAALVLILISACVKSEPQKSVILCGTSMIASMVRDLAPEAEIAVLVPPNSCPGSFDMKPGDAKKAASSKVFIIHPFQQYLVEKVKKINKGISVEVIQAKDLNLPGNYEKALLETERVMLEIFPGRQAEFGNRRQLIVRAMEYRIAQDFDFRNKIHASKTAVLCSVFQEPFARYCGFEIAGVFAGPDSMNPEKLAELIKTGREKKAGFLISNMTGDHGVTAGIINKHLKIRKFDLILFPLDTGGDSGFFSVYDHNMAVIRREMAVK